VRKKLAIFLPLIIAGIILAAHSLTVLSLETQGKVLFWKMVRPGNTFRLGYLHSVAKSDVWDTFQIDSQGRILLIETRFQGQAYGLPSGPTGQAQWAQEGDWFRITGIHRVLPSIDWRIQSEWKDRFRFQDEPEVDLSAQAGNGLIHIHVKKVRLIYWLGFYLRRSILTDWNPKRIDTHGQGTTP
jgi:hypothetical protein